MPLEVIWMDLEMTILSEVSQTKKNITCHLYMECKKKKKIQMNLFTKQKKRLTDLENKLMVTKGDRVGGIDRSLGLPYAHYHI